MHKFNPSPDNERGFVMRILPCSVDGCDCESAHDVWPDDDSREWLCDGHYDLLKTEEWIVFTVRGRSLMWTGWEGFFYLPERDANLHALAKNAGLV